MLRRCEGAGVAPALLVLLLGAMALAVSSTGCGSADAPASAHADGFTAFANLDDSAHYVGREACRPCHVGKSTSFAGTGMGRSFAPMDSDHAEADWSGRRLELPDGLVYDLRRSGDRYLQRQATVDAAGHESAATEHEMSWIVGSNHHNRTYLLERDGKLFQAPVCWYPDENLWDLCPGYELKNDHFRREVSASCVFCHNGVMRLVEGTRNEFERPFPVGIGCERCHGPGSLHVARWSDPAAEATGAVDPTIVNPARLPQARRIEVCSQCHLGDSKSTERVARDGRRMEDYRPGMPLESFMTPFRYAAATQWDFGLSAQVDRLVLSRCFTESAGAIDCLSCHDPHVTVYDPQRDPQMFRRACLGCHDVADCPASAAERAATAGVQDDCVACHMRRAEPDDQRHTTFTDHWIRRDIDLARPDRRERFDLEPVFPATFAGLPAADRLYAEARAALLFATDAPADRRAGLLGRAVAGFDAALAAGFAGADGPFFLGKALLFEGRLADAAAAFEAALERDPEHRDAAFNLGQCVGALGDPDRALEIFAALLTRNPADAGALAEYGRQSFALGRIDAALDAYARAVEVEPWNASLRMNHGMTLAAAGRFDDAAEAGRRAVELDPGNDEIRRFAANVRAAAN